MPNIHTAGKPDGLEHLLYLANGSHLSALAGAPRGQQRTKVLEGGLGVKGLKG